MPTTKELRAKQRDIEAEARKRINSMTDGTDDADLKRIESEVDALLVQRNRVADELENRMDAVLDETLNQPDPRRPKGEDRTVGGDDEEVAIALRAEQRFAEWAVENGASDEYRGLTLGSYLRAMTLGAKTDVEKRALSEGTDSAGGFTVPDILSANLIDLLRARTVAIRAGGRTVPLTSDQNFIAKVATDPVPAWRAENAEVAEGDPTFARVALVPKSLAVLVKASRELLDDSLNMEEALPRIMASAMAVELDRVSLFGSGTDPEPEGLVNISGVNEVAHGAALTGYGPLISARTKVLEANAEGVSAYIMHLRDEGELAGLTDSTGQPLNVPPAIARVPFLTSTSLPNEEWIGEDESTIVTGAFRHLLIGIRSDIRIEVLRERFADNLQYGFLAWMRADVAVEHAPAFTKITGITPPA